MGVRNASTVIPVQAGIQFAFAARTNVDSGLRRNDGMGDLLPM